MKILMLNENIKNLKRVVDNQKINAITEMNPVMSDAYEDSLETDEAIEKELKESDKLETNEPFLGAKNQPLPKDPVLPKVTLDESLFDDDSPLTDPDDGNYSLQEYIFDFLDHSDSFDPVEMVELVSDEFGMSPDEAERYVDFYEKMNNAQWHDTVDLEEESLNEDARPEKKQGKGIHKVKEEEDEDLWSLVYTSLIDHPDRSNYAANHAYNIDQLTDEERYEEVYTDYDGNIVVYGESEEKLLPAKRIADMYNLKSTQSKSSDSSKPEQKFKLTIIIPQDEVFNGN